MPEVREIIGHTIYILEGETDASLLARLAFRIWNLGANFNSHLFDETGHQTLITCGRTNLPQFLKSLPKFAGFSRVRRVVIMQDADDSLVGTLASICNFSNLHLRTSFPPNAKENVASMDPSGRLVYPWVAPFCEEVGDIERVLWETIAPNGHTRCVDSFLQCVGGLEPMPLKSPWKARLDAYLVTLPEPIYKTRHWFQHNGFPWDSSALDELKERLNALRASDPEIER